MRIAKSFGLVLLILLPDVLAADYLYVVTNQPEIRGFSIDAAGPTAAGAPTPLDSFPRAVAVASAGPFVYVIGGVPDQVIGLAIDRTDGILTPLPGSPYPATGAAPFGAAIGGLGRFLYVGNNVSGDISAYTIGPSGDLTSVPGAPFPAQQGIGSGSLAADPLGRYLYVAVASGVSVFRIGATGALSHVPGSPFALPAGAYTVAADPSGRFVYLANETAASIVALAVNAGTGSVSAIGPPFPSGPRPISITVAPEGKFVFVGNFPGQVSALTMNATTGALSSVAGSPFPTGTQPNALQVVAGQLYVADPQGAGPPHAVGGLSGYVIDPVTGQLQELAESPFNVGRQPWALAAYRTEPLPIPCGTAKGNGSLSTNPLARFHFNVGIRPGDGQAFGKLFFRDGESGRRFGAPQVESVTFAGKTATITGQGRSHNKIVRFQADVSDGDSDTFALSLSNGYTVSGSVRRTGIRISQCDPAVAPPDETEAGDR
jgi:6-phosphogluconolactonase